MKRFAMALACAGALVVGCSDDDFGHSDGMAGDGGAADLPMDLGAAPDLSAAAADLTMAGDLAVQADLYVGDSGTD